MKFCFPKTKQDSVTNNHHAIKCEQNLASIKTTQNISPYFPTMGLISKPSMSAILLMLLVWCTICADAQRQPAQCLIMCGFENFLCVINCGVGLIGPLLCYQNCAMRNNGCVSSCFTGGGGMPLVPLSSEPIRG